MLKLIDAAANGYDSSDLLVEVTGSKFEKTWWLQLHIPHNFYEDLFEIPGDQSISREDVFRRMQKFLEATLESEMNSWLADLDEPSSDRHKRLSYADANYQSFAAAYRRYEQSFA